MLPGHWGGDCPHTCREHRGLSQCIRTSIRHWIRRHDGLCTRGHTHFAPTARRRRNPARRLALPAACCTRQRPRPGGSSPTDWPRRCAHCVGAARPAGERPGRSEGDIIVLNGAKSRVKTQGTNQGTKPKYDWVHTNRYRRRNRLRDESISCEMQRAPSTVAAEGDALCNDIDCRVQTELSVTMQYKYHDRCKQSGRQNHRLQ